MCTALDKYLENDKNIIYSQNLLPQVLWWQFASTTECYKEWLDELQSIPKYLFAMKINLWQNSRKETLPLHCSPAREGPAGMSVILFNSDVNVVEDKTGDRAVTLIQLSCPYT